MAMPPWRIPADTLGPLFQRCLAMKILAAIAVALFVGGCAVHTPDGSVIVDPSPSYGHGSGKFCPPGQAKKGNC
ncbi:hypothetical protein CAL15_12040 [Bordetella genomosp. 13]|uniref:Vir-repressed protein n=1 Tax=Bordetella genomosp. 13 TaxID=463040 RepID=A0A1W6ZCG0_9BORD|nr:hypothetical protein CAL15_12040 [Bordetella genomosp. 13]